MTHNPHLLQGQLLGAWGKEDKASDVTSALLSPFHGFHAVSPHVGMKTLTHGQSLHWTTEDRGRMAVRPRASAQSLCLPLALRLWESNSGNCSS